jgi:hypothetical protein
MVTKGYQEGVYERVTTGTRGKCCQEEGIADIARRRKEVAGGFEPGFTDHVSDVATLSPQALQISPGYVPFPLKLTACGLSAASSTIVIVPIAAPT